MNQIYRSCNTNFDDKQIYRIKDQKPQSAFELANLTRSSDIELELRLKQAVSHDKRHKRDVRQFVPE